MFVVTASAAEIRHQLIESILSSNWRLSFCYCSHFSCQLLCMSS